MTNDYKAPPPIGIVTRRSHESIRAREILDAMTRYSEVGLPTPVEWVEELKDLHGRLTQSG